MHSNALFCQRIAVSWVSTRRFLRPVSASCVCIRGLHPQPMCTHWQCGNTDCVTAGRLQQAEQEAGRWRTTAAQAQAAADKLEADMEGLGNAYNMLEAHSHDLESRIQELESTGERHAPHSASSNRALFCTCWLQCLREIIIAALSAMWSVVDSPGHWTGMSTELF